MILFIKASDLTKNTPLGGNIDVDKYTACIWDAQMLKLEPLIGEALYNKISDDFENNNLNGKYLELFNNYIKPFLIHASAENYLLIGAYQITNGGILKHTTENSESVSKSEVDYLVVNQKSKADAYALRMKKWLCKSVNRIDEYYVYNQIVNKRSLSVGSFFVGASLRINEEIDTYGRD